MRMVTVFQKDIMQYVLRLPADMANEGKDGRVHIETVMKLMMSECIVRGVFQSCEALLKEGALLKRVQCIV